MFEIPSLIPTDRLELRLLKIDHAPLIMEARKESFSELKKWDIFTPENSPELITLSDDIKMCEGRMDRMRQRESLFYCIFYQEDNRFLGIVSLTKCDWQKRRAMLGFWLRTSETGKGYASEAAKELLNYGAKNLGLNVYSMHELGNQISRAVLLKIGFIPLSADNMYRHPSQEDDANIYYELALK